MAYMLLAAVAAVIVAEALYRRATKKGLRCLPH